jgi:phosphatidylinositol alpha-1,6-mannosyltransferase
VPVLLTNDFAPTVGGIQRYMERLAHALQDIGYSVSVVAPGPGNDSALPFRVERFDTAGRLARLLAMERALGRAHRQCDDGITIASTWNPAGLVAAHGRAARGKLAIFAMGSEVVRQHTPVRRTLMRSTFERADVVFSISTYTSKQLVLAGVAKEPLLLRAGVDVWEPQPRPARRPTILSVGRLIRRKGFDRVIEALPALLRFHPHVVYEVVGEGPDRSYLRDLAERLDVADRVRLLGSIDEAALREAYERAWCFALPVRREAHDVEGFGLVYLEAAIAGIAAVGGRFSGAEDAIVHGQTGLLVDGNDRLQIRDALDLLLRDRDFAALIGKAARKRALTDFSWQLIAEDVARGVGLGERAVRPRFRPERRTPSIVTPY